MQNTAFREAVSELINLSRESIKWNNCIVRQRNRLLLIVVYILTLDAMLLSVNVWHCSSWSVCMSLGLSYSAFHSAAWVFKLIWLNASSCIYIAVKRLVYTLIRFAFTIIFSFKMVTETHRKSIVISAFPVKRRKPQKTAQIAAFVISE